MCEVWKAPATLSGMTRALAGGFSARALSWSSVPAATVWPAPLTLAGVAPEASMAASTSAGSPPTTALMPVGVTAAAAAMLLAAFADKGHGFLSVSTPARAEAVISPTECPARITGGVPSSTSNRDLRGHQPGGDNQGLRHGGVLDGLLIGGGAVRGEVDACNLAEGGQMACYGRQFQPRGQETGGL